MGLVNNTNVIKVLNRAQRGAIAGSLNVLDASGVVIPGLSVRYDSDYDYLIFDNSSATSPTEFQTKYSTVEHKVGINPVNGKNALHIKIDTIMRTKVQNLYLDLVLNFDISNTDESVWSVIDDYADLLKKSTKERLSNEEEIGLVGEIIVLHQLMNSNQKEASVNFWKGPSGGLHDFVREDCWELEVKTSLNPNPVVKVHPIEQLEPISLPFHLIIIKLQSDKTKGISLPEWIDVLISNMKSPKNRKTFENSLLEAGYQHSHRQLYVRKFVFQSAERYKIDGSTKTLCPQNINPNVDYVDIRWMLRSSDYPMIQCDPTFWNDPVK